MGGVGHSSGRASRRKKTEGRLIVGLNAMLSNYHSQSNTWTRDSSRQTRRARLVLALVLLVTAGACSSKLYIHPAVSDPEHDQAAEVYFFRERHLAGSANATLVRLNGENLLRLRSGTYTSVQLKPGNYVVDVSASTWPSATVPGGIGWVDGSLGITVEPNQRYFLILRFTTTYQNQWLFYPELITDTIAKALMADYELVSAN